MISAPFPQSNLILGAGQAEYEPIHAYREKGPQGRVIVCFRLSSKELAEVAATRTIWIQQLTFGDKYHPIGLTTLSPFEAPKA